MRGGGMKTPWIIVIPTGIAIVAMILGVAHVAGSVIEGVTSSPANIPR